MGLCFLMNRKITSDNITVLSGDQHANFPLSNIDTDYLYKTTRFQNSEVILRIDLGSLQEIDTIYLGSSTENAFGVTSVSVRFSTTQSFSGDGVSLSMDNLRKHGILKTDAIDCRYVELTMVGGSFIEFSKIVIGKSTDLGAQNFNKTSFKMGIETATTSQTNRPFQSWFFGGGKRHIMSGELTSLNRSELSLLQDLGDVLSITTPFLIIPDPTNVLSDDGLTRYSLWGRLNSIPQPSKETGLLWGISLTINEAV